MGVMAAIGQRYLFKNLLLFADVKLQQQACGMATTPIRPYLELCEWTWHVQEAHIYCSTISITNLKASLARLQSEATTGLKKVYLHACVVALSNTEPTYSST
jgi:hypothetical protein